MIIFQKMSETEKEVMDVIWKQNEPVTSKYLLSYFNDECGKQWKTQTMSTFLARLAEKELLGFKIVKNSKYYYPLLTEKQYHQREAKYIVDYMYDGSVKNFVATLFSDNDDISKDELQELKDWFSER